MLSTTALGKKEIKTEIAWKILSKLLNLCRFSFPILIKLVHPHKHVIQCMAHGKHLDIVLLMLIYIFLNHLSSNGVFPRQAIIYKSIDLEDSKCGT